MALNPLKVFLFVVGGTAAATATALLSGAWPEPPGQQIASNAPPATNLTQAPARSPDAPAGALSEPSNEPAPTPDKQSTLPSGAGADAAGAPRPEALQPSTQPSGSSNASTEQAAAPADAAGSTATDAPPTQPGGSAESVGTATSEQIAPPPDGDGATSDAAAAQEQGMGGAASVAVDTPAEQAARATGDATATEGATTADPTSPASQPSVSTGAAAGTAVTTGGEAPSTASVPPPSFDLLRVEKDGSTVIAGQAAPGSQVEVKLGEQVLGSAAAGPGGDFAIVLDDPLRPGDHAITLEAKGEDGSVSSSTQTAVVSVPVDAEGEVLAMVEEPGQASKLLALPEATTPPSTETTEVPAADADGAAASLPDATPPASAAPAPSGAPELEAARPAGPATVVAPDAAPPGGGGAPSDRIPADTDVAALTPPTVAGQEATTPPPADGSGEAGVAAPEAGDAPLGGGPALAPLPGVPPVSVQAVEIEGRDVFVAGTAPAGSVVRVYAGEHFLGEAVAAPGGEFLVEAERELAVGDYVVRADVIDRQGKVIARAAVPFEREPGETVAAVAPALQAASDEPGVSDGPASSASGRQDAAAGSGGSSLSAAGETAGAPPSSSVDGAGAASSDLSAAQQSAASAASGSPSGGGGAPAPKIAPDMPSVSAPPAGQPAPGGSDTADAGAPSGAEQASGTTTEAGVTAGVGQAPTTAPAGRPSDAPGGEDAATAHVDDAGGDATSDGQATPAPSASASASGAAGEGSAAAPLPASGGGAAPATAEAVRPSASGNAPGVAADPPPTSTAEPTAEAGENVARPTDAETAQAGTAGPAAEASAATPETAPSGPVGGVASAEASAPGTDASAIESGAGKAARPPSTTEPADETSEVELAVAAAPGAAVIADSAPPVLAPKLQSVSGSVIIRRGDSLWRISRRVYGRGIRYSTIYLANQGQIRDPDMIWPGQVFTVPTRSTEGDPADLKAMGDQAQMPVGASAQ